MHRLGLILLHSQWLRSSINSADFLRVLNRFSLVLRCPVMAGPCGRMAAPLSQAAGADGSRGQGWRWLHVAGMLVQPASSMPAKPAASLMGGCRAIRSLSTCSLFHLMLPSNPSQKSEC